MFLYFDMIVNCLEVVLHIKTDIELVVAKICYPIEMYIMSVYRSPAYHMCDFVKTMTNILKSSDICKHVLLEILMKTYY